MIDEKSKREYLLLKDISKDLTTSLDISEVLFRTVKKIVNTVHAETITLYELDKEGSISPTQVYYHNSLYKDSWELKSQFAERRKLLLSMKFPRGTGIVGRVIASKEPIIIENASTDPNFCDKSRELGFVVKSVICAPLLVREEIIGAISVMNKSVGEGYFDKSDLELLETVAGVAAIGIKNARLCEYLKKSYFNLQVEKEKVLKEIGEREVSASKGEIVGFRKYVIGDMIGKGTFGEVFRAEEVSELGRWPVAIKVLKDEMFKNPILVESLKEEGRLVREYLNGNQHIVSTYFTDIYSGSPYIVMECVDGMPLDRLHHAAGSMGKKLPIGVIAGIIKDVCLALAHAWDVRKQNGAQLRMVHRDIKPGNILISREGIPKLSDFGIAVEKGKKIDPYGMITGTPNYMSPEQANGLEVDARSDIFSLGLVFYALLFGDSPYQTGETQVTLENARHGEVAEPPLELAFPGEQFKDIRLSLRTILKRALARDQDKRYQSAEEMYGAIQLKILNPLKVTDLFVYQFLRGFIRNLKRRDGEPAPKMEAVEADGTMVI